MTPEYLEIVVLRELRKVGFAVGQPRVHRRAELAEPERGFVLELVIPLSCAGATRRALVVCRRQDGKVGRDVIESARARLAEASADALIIFSTSEFAPEAQADSVALLRIVDGRSVFDASGWGDGSANHYPAWLPAHIAQLFDRDAAGRPRLRPLEAGRLEMILDAIGSGTHE